MVEIVSKRLNNFSSSDYELFVITITNIVCNYS